MHIIYEIIGALIALTGFTIAFWLGLFGSTTRVKFEAVLFGILLTFAGVLLIY